MRVGMRCNDRLSCVKRKCERVVDGLFGCVGDVGDDAVSEAIGYDLLSEIGESALRIP